MESPIVLGRVTRCTIRPMTDVGGSQASTVTSVAFGEFRRFASRMTQMPMPNQSATPRMQGTLPQTPAPMRPAVLSASGEAVAVATGLSSGEAVCASMFVTVKRIGKPARIRFMRT